MSYYGKMNFGLLGDFDAMADLNVLARGIEESLDELRVAAGVRKPRRRAPRRPARRREPVAERSGGPSGSSGSNGAGANG
jgi:hypothetical protein